MTVVVVVVESGIFVSVGGAVAGDCFAVANDGGAFGSDGGVGVVIKSLLYFRLITNVKGAYYCKIASPFFFLAAAAVVVIDFVTAVVIVADAPTAIRESKFCSEGKARLDEGE